MLAEEKKCAEIIHHLTVKLKLGYNLNYWTNNSLNK